MKTTIIIPARYGSTRFEGKPLALIKGKPMIQRVYEQAIKAKGIDAVFVATDDSRIADVVKSFDGQYVMTSEDAESGTDRIEEAIIKLGLADSDLVINLQGDQPLVNPETIEKLAAVFDKKNVDFEMATLGFEIKDKTKIDDPNQVKMVFDNNGYALYFSRAKIPFGRDTNDYPIYKHIGMYAYTARFVKAFSKLPLGRLESLEKLEQLRALENGYKIMTAISDYDSHEVDTKQDAEFCEELIDSNA